ncbi:MAG: hypothetical protein ACKOCH_09580, partial [Bacteroidota bacterium]
PEQALSDMYSLLGKVAEDDKFHFRADKWVNCCYCRYDEQDWLVIQNYLQASLDLARYCAFEYIKGAEARRNCSQIIYFCWEFNMRLAKQTGHRNTFKREYIHDRRFQICQKYLLLMYFNSAAKNILYKMDEKYIARG